MWFIQYVLVHPYVNRVFAVLRGDRHGEDQLTNQYNAQVRHCRDIALKDDGGESDGLCKRFLFRPQPTRLTPCLTAGMKGLIDDFAWILLPESTGLVRAIGDDGFRNRQTALSRQMQL